ncbi:MAG TPA: general stress protein [Actinomycetes bacterium]|nr:general stress protein [Actinomycetes bacterium]
MSLGSPLGSGRPTPGPAVASRPVVASYATYAEAQRAVDYLSDEKFPVQFLGILGRDLRIEEAVLGRMDWGKAAVSGLIQGVWYGLFVGLLISLFAQQPGTVILGCAVLGLAFGVGLGLLSYSLTGGHRDFVSRSAITATSYDVVCTWDHLEQAKSVLAGLDTTTT